MNSFWKPKSHCIFGALFLFLTAVGWVQAQGLTYVDADDFLSPNLTTSSGDPIGDAIDQFNLSTDNQNDNLWRFRGSESGNMFGAAGTVYEAWPGEDTQELVQTVSGLDASTSYDVYVVWWSATNDNWLVRAGLSSNPNANPVYDRTGAGGTPGTLGVFANWEVAPSDNLDIADGFPGIEAATVEGNRVMLVAKVGTTTPAANGDLEVFIDDAVNLAGVGRAWFDGVAYAPADTPSNFVSATIDRTTGNLSITAGNDYVINALNIESAAGSLVPTNWNSITGNLDGAGDSSFDVDAWQIDSETANSLSESEVGPIDGAMLGPGGESTLDLGNVWTASPFEDVIVEVTLNGSGSTVPISVEFTGGSQIALGDFDNDGDLDVDDYAVVLQGLNMDLAGMTDVESYALGDVTGDQLTNFQDIAAFRDLYDAANGDGAFNNLIPEPGAFGMLFFGLFALSAFRSRRFRKVAAIATCVAAMSFMSTTDVQAQITYVDADEQPGGNTNTLPGGWVVRGAGGGEVGETRNFANEGGVLQANEAVDEIATTFSIPDAGVYQIYSFFWDDGAVWNIQAGLASGDLTEFTRLSPGIIPVDETTQFAGSPTLVNGLNVLGQDADTFDDWVDGNRRLYAAPVGVVAAGAGEDVTVYINHDAAATQRTWYDGVGWGEAQPTLTLEVNTTTGAVAIRNDFDSPIDLSYYEISSESESLSRTGWNSLDDQNFDAVDGPDPGSVAGDSLLEGWDEAGSPTDNAILNETFFLGQSSIAAGSSISIGNAFSAGGMQDLDFAFGLVDDGALSVGLIEYVSSGVNGDFNGDLNWDCADIDALVAEVVAGTNNAAFDMNGDGEVNVQDITGAGGWLEVGGANNPDQTGGNPFLVGDANLNGSVDVSDFNVWNMNKFTNTAEWCAGDFNADGSVDVSDFNLWNMAKFQSSDVAAVPEPSCGWVALLIGLLAMRRVHQER